jgi:hypothetical protein
VNRAHIGASLAQRAGFVVNAEEGIFQKYGVWGAHGHTGPAVKAQITIYHYLNLSFGPLFFFSKHRCPFPTIRWKNVSTREFSVLVTTGYDQCLLRIYDAAPFLFLTWQK